MGQIVCNHRSAYDNNNEVFMPDPIKVMIAVAIREHTSNKASLSETVDKIHDLIKMVSEIERGDG